MDPLEAQFYGLLAADYTESVEIKDVDSAAFRRLLDFIYNSGALDWDMDPLEFWNLLHAAHMYLVPGLIQHCNEQLAKFMITLNDTDELIAPSTGPATSPSTRTYGKLAWLR